MVYHPMMQELGTEPLKVYEGREPAEAGPLHNAFPTAPEAAGQLTPEHECADKNAAGHHCVFVSAHRQSFRYRPDRRIPSVYALLPAALPRHQ